MEMKKQLLIFLVLVFIEFMIGTLVGENKGTAQQDLVLDIFLYGLSKGQISEMRFNPNGAIAFLITFTVCFLILSIVYNTIINGVTITDYKANLVSGIVGSLITLLTLIVTNKYKDK